MALILKDLHLLPVAYWAQFKMLILTFKTLNYLSSGYVRNDMSFIGLSSFKITRRVPLKNMNSPRGPSEKAHGRESSSVESIHFRVVIDFVFVYI